MPAEIAAALPAWHEFFVVGGHTGAVLLGLVFVGMEIHLDKIHENQQMYLIAAGSALGFLYVLLFSLVMLTPPLWPWVPGLALLGLSMLTSSVRAPRFWQCAGAVSGRRALPT